MANIVKIELLGRTISIKTDEEPEYIKQLVYKYKKELDKMSEKTSITDPLQLSIITSINMIDEMVKKNKKSSNNGQSETASIKIGLAEQLTNQMITEIDKALD